MFMSIAHEHHTNCTFETDCASHGIMHASYRIMHASWNSHDIELFRVELYRVELYRVELYRAQNYMLHNIELYQSFRIDIGSYYTELCTSFRLTHTLVALCRALSAALYRALFISSFLAHE